jgi:hypothetical protein
MRGTREIVVAVLLAASCQTSSAADDAKKPGSESNNAAALCSSHELDVFEEVFRHYVQKVTPRAPTPRAYYLRVRGEDPKPEMRTALAHGEASIYPGSQFRPGKGALIDLEKATFGNASDSYVEGWVTAGPMSGTRWRWRLKCLGGAWVLDEAGSEAVAIE